MSRTASVRGPEAEELRRTLYSEGPPDRIALAGLIARAADAPAWLDLVADVARDALLADGDVSLDDVDWLIEVCGDGRERPSPAEFAALLSVLRHGAGSSAELVAFAAREVERAILTGERRAMGGGDGEAGVVLAGDVAVLREIARDARPDRALAEVLFDIAHATATADNDPGFETFFADTLRFYLIGATPGARFDALLATLPPGAAAPEAAGASLADGLEDARYFEAADANSARYEAAAQWPAGETRWALAHLSRGALTPAERRLLAALRDPAAAGRVDRAA